jgi:hypothetical protein
MNRRDFSKQLLAAGGVAQAGSASGYQSADLPDSYEEPAKRRPASQFDVVVAGGGTGGVVTAIAAARQGAKTLLVEAKGYTGGTAVEGGTALHSYFNLWKAFPGVEKRQVVKGIPQEIVDRMIKIGGCSGHAEMTMGADYDSVCTAIDTELYKLVTMEMLDEAGVTTSVNTLLADAIRDGSQIKGVLIEGRSGREAVWAKSFVDCTAFGDLASRAGSEFSEINDYGVCNSIGAANVNVEKLTEYLKEHDALSQLAVGVRDGGDEGIVRLNGVVPNLPQGFREGARANGMSLMTTTTRADYLMFIKIGYTMKQNPTNRMELARTELELRRRQYRSVELLKKFVPGCEKAFIARTSPSLNIRRARHIVCDYDITLPDVLEARHFDDDVFVYGFHDNAPRLQIKDGGTYGIPYRALRVKGIDNLLATGMMITRDHDAHMSTRNTVACMGQGQAAGTAAALCAARNCGTRDLPYRELRETLEKAGVYFEG